MDRIKLTDEERIQLSAILNDIPAMQQLLSELIIELVPENRAKYTESTRKAVKGAILSLIERKLDMTDIDLFLTREKQRALASLNSTIADLEAKRQAIMDG
jgi:hypothetical protein